MLLRCPHWPNPIYGHSWRLLQFISGSRDFTLKTVIRLGFVTFGDSNRAHRFLSRFFRHHPFSSFRLLLHCRSWRFSIQQSRWTAATTLPSNTDFHRRWQPQTRSSMLNRYPILPFPKSVGKSIAPFAARRHSVWTFSEYQGFPAHSKQHR